ncbi:MAG: Uma2 family endonuclease [Phycisphaerales bacterium]
MSGIPVHAQQSGLAGLRMNAEEFFALGETWERLELIDGVTVVMPSPPLVHQVAIGSIVRQLDRRTNKSRAKGSAPEADPDVYMSTDVRFAERIVYRPDVSVFLPGRLPALPSVLDVAPDLVIEVVFDASRGLDLITKRDDYGRFGVREYWAIDPESLAVRVWRRDEAGGFGEVESPGPRVESSALPGLVLNMGEIRTA